MFSARQGFGDKSPQKVYPKVRSARALSHFLMFVVPFLSLREASKTQQFLTLLHIYRKLGGVHREQTVTARCNSPAQIHRIDSGLTYLLYLLRARQRSGEGVVRRNGCPKGRFWTTISPHDAFTAPLAHPHFHQEPRKGGFSQRGFCRVQCHDQENKKHPRILAQQYIWHLERHGQERHTFCKTPLQKAPLFLVSDYSENCRTSSGPQVPGCNRRPAPSCELWRSLAKFGELWRSLAKFGELWRTPNTIFTRTSLTFTRVPAKFPPIHLSSGEGFSKQLPVTPK